MTKPGLSPRIEDYCKIVVLYLEARAMHSMAWILGKTKRVEELLIFLLKKLWLAIL